MSLEKDNPAAHEFGHYCGDWYSGKKPAPTDTMSPIPVFFPTVSGANFQFIIASKDKAFKSTLFQGKALVEWLKETLSEHGIGSVKC